MTTLFIDLENGSDAADGLSFANRKKTLASASAAAGGTGAHEFRVMASPAPVDTTITASWTYDSETVTLSEAVTETIDNGTAWTASANVTATSSTSVYREGLASTSLAIASGFTTGLVAYKAFTATDFSGYEQVSLLIRSTVVEAAGRFELRLCSDAAGVTAVDTLSIPAIGAINTWYAVLMDKAAALGSSIQSVALYALVDPGTVTIYLDNIIACKAKSDAKCITHFSLISKANDGVTEPWFAVDSIVGTTVVLCAGALTSARRFNSSLVYCELKYQGSTAASVALYRRDPIVLAASDVTSVGGIGVDESAAAVTCGWDRTAMTAITDQTWVSFTAAVASGGFGANGTNYCRLSGVGLSHTVLWLYSGLGYNDFRDISLAGVGIGVAMQTGSNMGVRMIHSQGFTAVAYAQGNFGGLVDLRGLTFNGTAMDHNVVSTIGYDNTYYGMEWNITADFISYLTAIVRSAVNANHYYILRGASVRNVEGILYATMDRSSRYEMRNVSWSDMPGVGLSSILIADGLIYDARIPGAIAIFRQDSTYRHTASDTAWKIRATTGSLGPRLPYRFPVARVACNAGEARTVALWFYRTHTNHLGALSVDGVGIAGINAIVQSSTISTTATWEQLSVSFTPTVDCVVEVNVDYWYTEYSSDDAQGIWVDDFSVA